MQNISLRRSGMRRKKNFESWLFLFAFSPPHQSTFTFLAGNFWVSVTLFFFFAFFPGLRDWICSSCSLWHDHPAQISWQSCSWPLKLMTSQAAEGTWIRTGGYEQFKDEGVSLVITILNKVFHFFSTSPFPTLPPPKVTFRRLRIKPVGALDLDSYLGHWNHYLTVLR